MGCNFNRLIFIAFLTLPRILLALDLNRIVQQQNLFLPPLIKVHFPIDRRSLLRRVAQYQLGLFRQRLAHFKRFAYHQLVNFLIT